MLNKIHDVIVVGAGPGGSSAAYHLARYGLDVLLIDKSLFPRDKTCGDALTPRAIHALSEMGIELANQSNAWRVNLAEVVSPGGDRARIRIPSKAGWPDHLFVLPRFTLDDLVRERAETAGARLETPIHARTIRWNGDHALLDGTRRGESIAVRGRVLVLATGANTALLTRNNLLPEKPPLALAVRAYFEGCTEYTAADVLNFHFDLETLPDLNTTNNIRQYRDPGLDSTKKIHRYRDPGYGWVFPVSETAVNAGVAIYAQPGRAQKCSKPANPHRVFEAFLNSASVRSYLGNTFQRKGFLEGFPIRMDFPGARTFGERVLMVGEAAGLVNPLTGDGIDFALDSGRLAAGYVNELFRRGDFSLRAIAGYDRLLRRQFGSLFAFSRLLQRTLTHPELLDLLVRGAQNHPVLAKGLASILLGPEGANHLGRRLVKWGIASADRDRWLRSCHR